jgi:hypothetical protein
MYLKAAEAGLSIFEYDPNHTLAERKQFTPLVEWVASEHPLRGEITPPVYEIRQIRRVSF